MGGLLKTVGKIALWTTFLVFAGAVVLVGIEHHHTERVGGFEAESSRAKPRIGGPTQAQGWKALGAHIIGIAIALIVCSLCLLPFAWYYFMLGIAPAIVKFGIGVAVLVQNGTSWIIHAPLNFCSHYAYIGWGLLREEVGRLYQTTLKVALKVGLSPLELALLETLTVVVIFVALLPWKSLRTSI